MADGKPFRQVWLCGRWDEAGVLSEIVGWAVGSHRALEYAAGITELEERGLTTTRHHVAPAGEWESYALTEAGFSRLNEIGYRDMYERAVEQHAWYAERGCMTKAQRGAALMPEPRPSPYRVRCG